MKYCAARIAPNVLDILGLKGLDQNLGTAQIWEARRFRVCRSSGSGGQFGLGYFHDEPLRISLTKHLGCPFVNTCGAASGLEILAMNALNAASNQNPFAF
jgi:hypothetical protein